MASEALTKALHYEDFNLRLALKENESDWRMSESFIDRLIALHERVYAHLTPVEKTAAKLYAKHKWRVMGGKINAAEERVLPRLKSRLNEDAH